MTHIAVSCAALLMLSCLTLASTVARYGGDCDTLDRNVELKLNQLFDNLPKKYTDTRYGGTDIGSGVFVVGNATLSGLDNFETISRYQTFCKGEEKRVIANIRSSFLEISHPWKFCSEDMGAFSTESTLVGLEVVFVVGQTDEGIKLRVRSVTPLILEAILVHFLGAGSAAGTTFSTLGHLFPGPFRTYWSNVMPNYISEALTDTLAKMPQVSTISRKESEKRTREPSMYDLRQLEAMISP